MMVLIYNGGIFQERRKAEREDEERLNTKRRAEEESRRKAEEVSYIVTSLDDRDIFWSDKYITIYIFHKILCVE